MSVGLARMKSLSREITDLRCDKILLLQDYEKLKEINDNYRDRRLEAKLAVFTRKINTLEDIRKRYENSK